LVIALFVALLNPTDPYYCRPTLKLFVPKQSLEKNPCARDAIIFDINTVFYFLFEMIFVLHLVKKKTNVCAI
jgi:hypothetical protein